MDRTIGLVSPFFTMVGKEVHHKPRYERMPAIAVLGINHGDCDRCPEIFRTLIYRMAREFFPRWLYIVMGNWGWKRQARKYGVRQELFARPYYSVQPDKGGIKRVGG